MLLVRDKGSHTPFSPHYNLFKHGPQFLFIEVFESKECSAAVWTALTLYHNAGHGHDHLRTSAGFSSAHICDRTVWLGFFIADQNG
jgi:hypothetical protein